MNATNLQRLIDVIDGELWAINEVCGPLPQDSDTRSAWWVRRTELLKRLEDKLSTEEGARFSYVPAHDHRLFMAGIRTSSTAGWFGVLRNWQVAARKRIEKAAA